ncbi:MAG: hypothetical protein WB998_07395 [Solirubrobacteraceae bacterium]
MMSILEQLERDLLEAANRGLAGGTQVALGRKTRGGWRRMTRGWRLSLIACGCVLASATIALAATGVILTGAPVRPESQPNPAVGQGAPVPGASRLLSLRVPDPEGGLEWGMKVVRTTRGELCIQIGRVQDTQLGQLGIDGVFHDDGRFHAMPADILPGSIRQGVNGGENDATATVSCVLTGQAVAGEHRGVDRSAGAANGRESARPRSELRDIYFGLLGPQAVSVTFQAGRTPVTIPVLEPLGAYLIVRRAEPREQVGVGGASIGSEGDLPAYPPLTAIAYRLAGKLCERGPVVSPGGHTQVTDPCPAPHWPAVGGLLPRELHQPLHVRLEVSHRSIAGVLLSFKAPFAVKSAKQDYTIRIPGVSCGRQTFAHRRPEEIETGYDEVTLGRDVAKGAAVTHRFSAEDLFAPVCGLPSHPKAVHRSAATIEVLYQSYQGAAPVIVGKTVVRRATGVPRRATGR